MKLAAQTRPACFSFLLGFIIAFVPLLLMFGFVTSDKYKLLPIYLILPAFSAGISGALIGPKIILRKKMGSMRVPIIYGVLWVLLTHVLNGIFNSLYLFTVDSIYPVVGQKTNYFSMALLSSIFGFIAYGPMSVPGGLIFGISLFKLGRSK